MQWAFAEQRVVLTHDLDFGAMLAATQAARPSVVQVRTQDVHGRHTFISHALAGGRTLAEVRDAAGHANVTVTSGYLHLAVTEQETVGQLFE